jgi:superfamily II DNA or RNA helicase
MNKKDSSQFCRKYELAEDRKHRSSKTPAAHQAKAIDCISKWYQAKNFPEAGAILVLPTGGGKTFTSVRFLCKNPLSDGYKVLWLAHTHHLLEQAFYSFEDSVSEIAEPKKDLHIRVVSGTPGHFRPHSINASDDVIIGTLQTIQRAYAVNHPNLADFIRAAEGKLFVIFDEAHHSPAPSYRKLILALREQCDQMFALGLTATPTYQDEKKKGWLKKVFPQGIIHQVPAQELMAAGILAKPILEDSQTKFTPEFDEREYQKWEGTNQDLPENIITKLANDRDRNSFIAEVYAKNKDRYGKTIIFADRWFQCEAISESLQKRGIKSGSVYSHVDANPGSAEERNRKDRDENADVLEKFRTGDIDVLLNVRMLTEGTDVPKTQTVFLTRQTTSQILMTQMVGRALRGPKFGGTSEAYIVAFIDNWKQAINWADYDQIVEGLADDRISEYEKRPPLQLISIELVRRLARQMDTGINIAPGPFLTMLPMGWYKVEYTAQVKDTDETENIQHLVMVFEKEIENYKKFIEHILQENLKAFEDEAVFYENVKKTVEGWQNDFFPEIAERFGTSQTRDLFEIVRHIAQSGLPPAFFDFEERKKHDLDELATEIFKRRLDRVSEDQTLRLEYNRSDRYWTTIYYNYGLFRTQYDSCFNRILDAESRGEDPVNHTPIFSNPEIIPDCEPSEDLKRQVKENDGCCLCCGSTSRLEVDHINPVYFGGGNIGGNILDNFQTLCKTCNLSKGIQKINFRDPQTDLNSPLKAFPKLELPQGKHADHPNQWKMFLRRSINFFYMCSAVHRIKTDKKGTDWFVELKVGNDPEWLTPYLNNLLEQICIIRVIAGYEKPKFISVSSPDKPEIMITENDLMQQRKQLNSILFRSYTL